MCEITKVNFVIFIPFQTPRLEIMAKENKPLSELEEIHLRSNQVTDDVSIEF